MSIGTNEVFDSSNMHKYRLSIVLPMQRDESCASVNPDLHRQL